jgi:di/tricarboxylate transporter
MKRRMMWLAIAALAIGAAVLLYRGPGRGVIRGHVGDVAATMLVYAMLGMIWRARPAVRAAAALAIATLIECGQMVWRGEEVLGAVLSELTVGSTFDGWDFVAYGAGVVIAVAWERWGAWDGAWDGATAPPQRA